MPSLKEIKGRIGSVKNTLKITSAMKLVASSKLRKAQSAIESMLPYEKRLHMILEDLMADYAVKAAEGKAGEAVSGGGFTVSREVRKVAIIAYASNSSLCGAFNANAVRKVMDAIEEYHKAGLSDDDITIFSIGRKMADAMKRIGFTSPADFTKLSDKPNYAEAAALAEEVMKGFMDGTYDRVELIYNHFVSTATQKPLRDVFLPLSLGYTVAQGQPGIPPQNEETTSRNTAFGVFIVEPSTAYEVEMLLPKVLKLKVYTVLLDSAAAEHAARTVAMQTATDNGEDLLQELTLEYNKGRQQKITSEILDLVGGSFQ